MSQASKMLWFKAWAETRRFFLLGMFVLISMVGALNVSFPGSPEKEFPHGALAVGATEVRSLPQDARSYIWLHWSGNTLVIWLPLLALALASTGFPPRTAATGSLLHLLTMPISRRKVAGIRISLGFAEIAAAAVIPSLLICLTASIRGLDFSFREGLVGCLIAIAGAAPLYALFVFLSAMLGEMSKAVLGGAILFLYGLFTFLVSGVRQYSILRLITGDMYFIHGEIPWPGIAVSLGAAMILVAASVRIVETRDY